MNKKFYVCTDSQDPGSEHLSYEEARECVLSLEKQGLNAIIFGPGLDHNPEYVPHWWHNPER